SRRLTARSASLTGVPSALNHPGMPPWKCVSAVSPATWTAFSIRARSSARPSCSGNGHLRDEGGGGIDGAAQFEIVGRLEVAKHGLEIGGNGDLAYRKGHRAVFDPEAGGAAAVIAGDTVHPHADELGDEEAAAHGTHQCLRAAPPRRQRDIRWLGGGRAGCPAAGMTGAGKAKLAGGMLV